MEKSSETRLITKENLQEAFNEYYQGVESSRNAIFDYFDLLLKFEDKDIIQFSKENEIEFQKALNNVNEIIGIHVFIKQMTWCMNDISKNGAYDTEMMEKFLNYYEKDDQYAWTDKLKKRLDILLPKD